MDKIESLTNTISNITLYDIKSMYNQAKNVVLNVSEMEAKVREATNDDPWGASSTLMQDIAQGTFHFQYFNEIMPSIYARFMEKEARQWRQIYKALQLLEYLIKHGSERVVDDARSHISTIKMLRNFHYIDEKGKDEGINVRNRARELVELLSDVEKIRSERRKAKANKSKYVGVGNDGMAFGSGGGYDSSGGGSRYGGFGSDSLASSSYNTNPSDHYNSGAGARSSSRAGSSSFSDSRRGQFEEYNAGDDEVVATPVRSNSTRTPARKNTAPPPTVPAPVPEVDLLGGFDDDTPAAVPAPSLSTNKALPAVANPVSLDDDDFDDFQAAPVQATPAAPVAAPKKPNLMDMLGGAAAPVPSNTGFAPTQQQQPMGYGMGMGMGMGMGGHRQTPSISSNPGQFGMQQPVQPSMFGGAASQTGGLRPTPVSMGSSFSAPGGSLGGASARPPSNSSTTTAPKASANFDDLWNLSLGSAASKPAVGAAGAGKSIKDLEKEKATAGLWGSQQKPPAGYGASQGGAFGSFGNAAPPSSGGDDLLL